MKQLFIQSLIASVVLALVAGMFGGVYLAVEYDNAAWFILTAFCAAVLMA